MNTFYHISFVFANFSKNFFKKSPLRAGEGKMCDNAKNFVKNFQNYKDLNNQKFFKKFCNYCYKENYLNMKKL